MLVWEIVIAVLYRCHCASRQYLEWWLQQCCHFVCD